MSPVDCETVLSNLVEAVVVLNRHGVILECNRSAERVLDRSAEEFVGRSVSEIFGRAVREDGGRLLSHDQPWAKALEGRGLQTGEVMVARDLTESREGEERLRASLREKEVLIREIHHRVKNNLQIIASMLNLQTGCISDDYSRLALRDSQNRIRTLALVHEKLYSSGDVSQIAVKDFIGDLTSSLFRLLSAASLPVALRLDLADVSLDLDAVIPLALILNELLSNSLQHAFPDGREGEIAVVLGPASTSRLELVVADDGVGLPGKLDYRETETLGLQLVCLLTTQLGGTIKLDTHGGTVFTIEFPESGVKGQSQ